MVTLYTWGPTTPETILAHTVAPDVGHSALAVRSREGVTQAYISFWPEPESLIGRITQLWKHRPARYPASYAQETDPDQGFMQRPADHEDVFEGLDESVIVGLWQKLQATEYDFSRWNCSNVCKFLLLSAMHPRLRPLMEQALETEADDAGGLRDLVATLSRLSASSFIDCSPLDLRQLAEAYVSACQSSPTAASHR